MNLVILMGRITRDIDLKQYKDVTVARFGIAVDKIVNKEKQADFINITCFGKTAEFANKYFKKGARVAIEGCIRTSTYQKENGEKKYSMDVVATKLYFADGKKDNDTSYNDNKSFFVDVKDDELPF